MSHGELGNVNFTECPGPVSGKFMVCTGHRLQCIMPNCTSHKFPRYGSEIFEMQRNRPEEVRQEVKARGGAIIKIKFAREISDVMLWNV